MNFLYEKVAAEIENRISNGTYQAGDRLPGVRRLSAYFEVSVSTAIEAYRLLEDRGCVEVRPRSGYYVRARMAPARAEPSDSQPTEEPTPVTGQQLVLQIARIANGGRHLQLAAAVPDAAFLPITSINRALMSVTRKYAAHSARYAMPSGHPELRMQIARRMNELRCTVSPEEIVITSGAQEALTLALRAVCRPGDIVALESPAFYGLLQVLEASGLRVLEIPTHPTEGLSLEALELALERWPISACVVVTNFSNPLGVCMNEARKEALVRLLSAHRIPLIEDDIYGDLGFGVNRPGVAKAWDVDGGVIYCSSYSKTLSPGLRVGYIIPGRQHEQVVYEKFLLNLSSAVLPQLAVAYLLERRSYDRYLRQVRQDYATAVARVSEAVQMLFPDGTRISHPQGGFLLWVQMPSQVDALTLHRIALNEGVLVAPGPLFSASGKYTNHIRLNCALPWDARLQAGLRHLAQVATRLANGETVTGSTAR